MRSRTAIWFECRIKYEKTMDDGLQKKVSETYTVDALSVFEVDDIKKATYKEIFFSENENDDRWYKAKLEFITIDEKTEKEKRSAVNYLVQASTLHGALKNIDEVMGGTMIDYVLVSLAETKLMDVYEYRKNEQNDPQEEVA